jgi:hypothetical protein
MVPILDVFNADRDEPSQLQGIPRNTTPTHIDAINLHGEIHFVHDQLFHQITFRFDC